MKINVARWFVSRNSRYAYTICADVIQASLITLPFSECWKTNEEPGNYKQHPRCYFFRGRVNWHRGAPRDEEKKQKVSKAIYVALILQNKTKLEEDGVGYRQILPFKATPLNVCGAEHATELSEA